MGFKARILALSLIFWRWGCKGDWDLGLGAGNLALKLEFGPWDWVFALKARIWASRLEFGPQGWDLGLKVRPGFGSQGWNLGLEATIWASRLGFWLWAQNFHLKVVIWAFRLDIRPREGGGTKEEETEHRSLAPSGPLPKKEGQKRCLTQWFGWNIFFFSLFISAFWFQRFVFEPLQNWKPNQRDWKQSKNVVISTRSITVTTNTQHNLA